MNDGDSPRCDNDQRDAQSADSACREHFAEFKKGNRTIFVIMGPPGNPAVPRFVFRKVSDHEVAILAWRDRTAAESWRLERRFDLLTVIEWHYSDLVRLLEPLSPAARARYSIELF